jgi:outer membrane protein, multidrug efflux system
VRRSVEASDAVVESTVAARQDVMVSLISEVARNYFELRGAQNELAVARANVENQRDTLELIETKLRAGRGTELDAARARSQLNSTLSIIPPLEASVKAYIFRLSVLSGQQPGALEAELKAPLPLPGLPKSLSIGRPEDLLRRRPDIREAERALASATARIGIQTADLFPRVTFNGTIGFEATELAKLTKSGGDTYSFGPRITWAALDLGRVRARIAAAKAQAEAEIANYERTVLGALEETETALVYYGQEQARRDYLRLSNTAATDAVNLAKQRFEGGVVDYLTVLDAQRTQLTVQDQLAQSETRTATALVSVYKALGGGWEIEQGAK